MWCVGTVDPFFVSVNIKIEFKVKMRIDNAIAADVLERMLSAYGFAMQKELAEHLDIAKSNVAGWLQRGQVPGNAIVQCALDTGVDVGWLVNGEFANANLDKNVSAQGLGGDCGKTLIKKMLSTGGKPVLLRIMSAYGFTTQKELSEYLGISTGTISTWVRREYFPGDVVITCSLDTGVSLEWLATGEFGSVPQQNSDTTKIPFINKKILLAGKLEDDGTCFIDQSFVPEGVNVNDLNFIRSGKLTWLIKMGSAELSNGKWLLDIDGLLDIYTVSRLPGNKLRIIGSDTEFDCASNEVIPKGIAMSFFKKIL